MSTIRFRAPLLKIGSWILLRLPKSESAKLPSKGMVMVNGNLNNSSFQAPLEPDGKGSHWLKVDESMQKAAKADVGDTVKLEIEPTKQWPEPVVPKDLKEALAAAPQAHKLWMDITPMARWDWIRWIGATKNPETRKRRIDVTFSKFKAGKRRPCCFNRTQCTVPDVSNNGVLLEPKV
ncbi:MAG: protein of unknown function DUF1905 [uncultured bacterium]|uniref:DUF1905 domain-containing protein n=3 Tax=Candidatus Daviesiibacteriota TaxID=1752718 RepID=A0A1F5K3F2_9BACT|nr:MAG: protein of unknown function DUF1905 [uncultured bacterium]KKQ14854.1 MAG: hypothetical protein US28_C0028G0018 [Candidatus Daviesbacteria bacterium GW2011_GWA1_36_8]OGE16755.1 MAG: hypothetical protein A2858_03990 [Candidatus Daviesbacteria bacterium RIFCSPHIGHO2_01_FULL_36_37]OGE35298.1 MAG: hypothetical protein A3E66_00365 [Candidatus Daviesbacteria bacterium RIFCSPHIGHO2_12_FULL_37_16]